MRSRLLWLLALFGTSLAAQAGVQATHDIDEVRTTPVAHRYIHGVIPDDAKFQILLPVAWNGKLVIFTRGFSGTELTAGAFQAAAISKGYAFASSDEGWNRVTIKDRPQDSYYESRQRLVELTLYTKGLIQTHYGRAAARTLLVGSSNGGHHTRWMIEDYPRMFDGGIAGFGFNSQVSQWGSAATVVRNYDVIASRIDDIIARRASKPSWNPFAEKLSPPLSPAQIQALRHLYNIPATLASGFAYDVGRWPGSETQWKSQYGALMGYLRDSLPRFDETFNPRGAPLTDDDIKQWDPSRSPAYIQRDLHRLDLSGDLARPIIVMHGTADNIVSPGETEGYKKLVEQRLGRKAAREVLAVYYIPGMGHGGAEFDELIPAQIDALEAWIDYRESGGKSGAPAPDHIGRFPREPEGLQAHGRAVSAR
jgi:pimeloyl-ACP methyl ester carboxylesterase